ncbi:ABC transporter permease, partial [Ensifer sp. SSB1]|uniref:ABC transporter permease n=1 Tax=Ensifer sp. SSB1 TaxID=2795385 RepID=UPI001A3E8EBD
MVFIAPLIMFLCAAYFIPLIGVLAWSFTQPTLGISNYTAIATDSGIQAILWRTFRICLMTGLAATAMAYLLAYQWVYGPPLRRRFIELAILVPFWISVLIRAFGWLVLLRPNGLINEALMAMGLVRDPIPLVRNELGVVIGMTQYMVPFAFFPLVAVMRQIDGRILQAARGMGAGAIRRFFEVFLPLSLPGIVGAF